MAAGRLACEFGSPFGGVIYTSEDGVTWVVRKLDLGVDYFEEVLAVDGQIFAFAGTSDKFEAVFISNDDGLTWTKPELVKELEQV